MSLNLVILAAVVLVAGEPGRRDGRFDAESVAFFEKKVRPLLVNNCNNCHSASTNAKGGLRVDDRNGLIQGGNRGPAVVPGDPENSLLIQAVLHLDADLKMPPKKRLAAEEVAVLTKWITDGAAWTEVNAAAVTSRPTVIRHSSPAGSTGPAAATEIHPAPQCARRIMARDRTSTGLSWRSFEDMPGWKPVRDADKLTLIRRATFDLAGLPPISPEEVDAFLRDQSSGAFEQVVDRLLASPAFGERWGAHWLDVARYESTGSSKVTPLHAWRYRDYVIDAFTRDKPFDTFIREQIAGDLFMSSSPGQRDEQVIATGFLGTWRRAMKPAVPSDSSWTTSMNRSTRSVDRSWRRP